MRKYEKMKNMDRLSATTIDLLHLINKNGKNWPKNEVVVHLFDDQQKNFQKGDVWNVSDLLLCKLL